MNVRERARLVDALSSAIADGEQSLGQVPALLKKILDEGAWKDFETRLGKPVHHERFEDFVTTPPLEGLGADIGLVESIVKDDPDTLLLLHKTLKRPEGGDKHNYNITDTVDNVNSVSYIRPSGNAQIYALQRLEQDRPDLLEQVKEGKLSPHAAMIQAGFRRRIYSVNLDNPKSAAALVKRASPALLQELRRLLIEEALHS